MYFCFNTVYLNTLLYCLCSNNAKIWACCCCKAWIAWLCWACICWFCRMSWLCCPSRVFLSLFYYFKSSDLNWRFCSSFSRRERITLLNLLLCSYPQCHLHLAPYVFMSLQIFALLFITYFLCFLFFCFDIRLSFLSICFSSTFTFFKSLHKVFKKLLIFR